MDRVTHYTGIDRLTTGKYEQIIEEPIQLHQRGNLPTPDQQRQASEQTVRRVPTLKSLFRSWLWESLASLLSLASLISIVAVLSREDGQLLENWSLNRYISPTALISFLSTVGKSSFLMAATEVLSQLKWLHFDKGARNLYDLHLFDSASRGPLGATRLLYVRRWHNLLGSVMAAVIIASLLVDPFTQLVFDFQPYQQPLGKSGGGVASFLTASVYDPALDAYGEFGTTIPNGEFDTNLDPNLISAILSGVFDTVAAPAFTCDAERCTWNDTTTLGICSVCGDTAPVLRRDCKDERVCTYSYPDADDEAWSQIPNANSNLSTLWIPYSPLTLLSAVWGNQKGVNPEAPIHPYHTIWNSTSAGADSYTEFGVPISLGQFTSIQLPATPSSDVSQSPSIPPIQHAWSCALYPCARTYQNISVTNRTLAFAHGPSVPLVGSSARNATPPAAPRLQQALQPLSGAPANFSLGDQFPQAVSAYISALFSSSFDTDGLSLREAPASGASLAPNVARFLAQSGDVAGMMERVAEAMTEVVRTGANATAVEGERYRAAVLIRVRWGWLVLPAVLTVVTVMLMGVVIAQTRTRGVASFKSSDLAVLFCRGDGGGRADGGRGSGTDEAVLEERAKGIRARLGHSGDGLDFLSRPPGGI